jgi:hypothetical protein
MPSPSQTEEYRIDCSSVVDQAFERIVLDEVRKHSDNMVKLESKVLKHECIAENAVRLWVQHQLQRMKPPTGSNVILKWCLDYMVVVKALAYDGRVQYVEERLVISKMRVCDD